MTAPQPQATDWRGVPILLGDTVIYAATRGDSIVEGTVEKLKPITNRYGETFWNVSVKVVRQNKSWGSRAVNTIGNDRCTVIAKLPEATAPSRDEMQINLDTHDLTDNAWSCGRCKNSYTALKQKPCPYGRV